MGKKTVMVDLTKGKPMSLIIGFALPMFLGTLFQQFYSMVDTIIVGKLLGLNALAGVGSTGAISFMINGFVIGLCSGFAIPVAQKFGAKQESKLRKYVGNLLWLSIIFSVVMTALIALATDGILRFMNTPEETFSYAFGYIFIIFLGIPTTFLYNMTSSTIRALGDSKTPLYFLIFAAVLNIIFFPVFCVFSICERSFLFCIFKRENSDWKSIIIKNSCLSVFLWAYNTVLRQLAPWFCRRR